MLLAGDVGGTKVDLGLFTAEGGPRSPVARAQFPSAEFPDLAPIVARFLADTGLPVDRACLAVAGPVIDGGASITNLPWVLSERQLSDQIGVASVHLMNDLEAITTGVIGLPDEDLHVVNAGISNPRGTVAVIAPGTGLGEGFATWTESGYRAYPSEGGHTDFAPADQLQAELLQYLRPGQRHVSFERVCSGMAVPSLYAFLRDTGRVPEDAATAALIARSTDRTRTIFDSGLARPRPDPLSAATIDLFVSILGSEAGNLALKVLSTGGVYLAGGIPVHILTAIEGGFMRYFKDKGRLSPVLERMPVRVVLTRAALIGAAITGLGLGHSDTTRGQ